MKKHWMMAAGFGLAVLLGGPAPASQLSDVKAKVKAAAEKAGVDLGAHKAMHKVKAGARSQKGSKAALNADAVLSMAEDVASGAAGKKAKLSCSLDNCPHAVGLADAKASLADILAKLPSADAATVESLATDLHHVAASVRKARLSAVGWSDKPAAAPRSSGAVSEEQAKLAVASDLAEAASQLAGR